MSNNTDGQVKGVTGHFGDSTNYTEFEADGTLKKHGNATVWGKIVLPSLSMKVPATAGPDFAQFMDDGDSSIGVFLPWYDKAADEMAYSVCETGHSWVEGGTIYPHIHWTPKSNDEVGGKLVSWGLEYSWATEEAVFPNSTIVYNNNRTPEGNLVAGTHCTSEFAGIELTDGKICSALIIRVFRNATAAGGQTDDYDDDAGLINLCLHFQRDTVGSRAVHTK